MQALRPVNEMIGDLRGHFASALSVEHGRIIIWFEPLSADQSGFCVMLDGALDFIDRGLMYRPLTAGIIWQPIGPYGRQAASRLGVPAENLVELRIDYEDREGLRCLFQAVARSATVFARKTDAVDSEAPQFV